MIASDPPFREYVDLSGAPLDSGYLYFGLPNQNPETAPITVFWDAAGTQPALQPIRTTNGLIIHNGAVSNLYISVSYSMTVRDRTGGLVFYGADSTNFDASSTFSTPAGAAQIGVAAGGTVQDALDSKLPKAGGTMTGAINEAHGADIASATTINLTTATGNLVDVTGTAPISAVTLADGAQRTVRFTGILQLTNGASFILPGGANITTAVGDFAVLRGYAAGVVRCVSYTRTDGRAVLAGINFDGIVAAPVTTTWTRATAAGKFIYTSAAGATTQTLPLASTMPSGTAIAYFNNGAGTPTFTRQGSDGMLGLVGGGTSFVLNTNEAVICTTDGSSWFCNFLNGATGLAPQTLQNVAGSRVAGTLYTNATGREIIVMISLNTSGTATLIATVDGLSITGSAFPNAGGSTCITFPVPPGKTYSAINNGGTSVVNTWVEKR